MDELFWKQAWKDDRTAFHQKAVNPVLKSRFDQLCSGLIEKGSVCFVPLCGKSHDMTWMVSKGMRVIGIDVSEIAAREYFEERGVTPDIAKDDRFVRWSGGGVEFIVGNFFELLPEDLQDVKIWYDRAALIALPAEMRNGYIDHMSRIVPVGSRGLVLTITYDQSAWSGPPFSVDHSEITKLTQASGFTAELLEEEARFSKRFGGIRVLHRAYLVESK